MQDLKGKVAVWALKSCYDLDSQNNVILIRSFYESVLLYKMTHYKSQNQAYEFFKMH